MIRNRWFAAALGVALMASCTASAHAGQWDDVVAAAKKEGKVVLGTNLGMPKFRQDVTRKFKARYGIDVELRSMRGSELTAVARRECSANRPSMDVLLSGNSEITRLYPKGCLREMKSNLLLPSVTDGKQWRGGALKWNDPEHKYMLQLIEYVNVSGIYNTTKLKAEEINSVKHLLEPRFKGKIASYDPRRGGAGKGAASFFLAMLGDEYVVNLYKGQEVVYTANHRQLADWIARGVYSVGLGAVARQFDPLRKKGLPIGVVRFKDLPGKLTGGSGVIKLVKGAPNPNGAVVLLNWLADQEGQQVFERHVRQKSRRLDVNEGLDDYVLPKEGVQYHDDYAYEFYTVERPRARKRLTELLGR